MKAMGIVVLALCAAFGFAPIAAAQRPMRRAPGTAPDDMVGVEIALQAGSHSYRFTGKASCTQEPKGYIYSVPAALWRVAQSDGARNVMLTFWRPANGSGDMFTLSVQDAGKTYRADTVKTKDGGAPQGSGEVRFTPAGAGGTFTVSAISANGVKVSGTIKCDAFRAATAEGGN